MDWTSTCSITIEITVDAESDHTRLNQNRADALVNHKNFTVGHIMANYCIKANYCFKALRHMIMMVRHIMVVRHIIPVGCFLVNIAVILILKLLAFDALR